METKKYDLIVIGAGSGGLSVSLFLNLVGIKVLIVEKSDKQIGGECLNDGCVPSKALIHVAKIIHAARSATHFGLDVSGQVNIKSALDYVRERQEIIRKHENADFFEKMGMDLVLGEAYFTGKNEITVDGKLYHGKKIVIATGSKPVKLKVPGIELVNYLDNTIVFDLENLPARLLFMGAGPISLEMAQAFCRMGSQVTVVTHGDRILSKEDDGISAILLERLKTEGIQFIFNSEVEKFISSTEAILKSTKGHLENISFDAVFIGIGRELQFENLQLQNAEIKVNKGKIVVDKYLRTTNKNVLVAGDVAGNLIFSHAAEQHGRLIINNLLSPFKKSLSNEQMSWVTFTDPEVATFGLNEQTLKERKISYKRLEHEFKDDDRAITDNYRYGKLVLFTSKVGVFQKNKILGGTMIAPQAGELIQELVLSAIAGISTDKIFNKIYAYPVASRVNQQVIIQHETKKLTGFLKMLIRFAFRMFN